MTKLSPITMEQLSRLSDSTIQRIFQFFEDAELYEFSMTSRRMHQLALSMLLSRRNIPNPPEKVDIRLGDGSNTLQILRIALFMTSIRQLSVRFSPGTTSGMVGSFPQAALEQLQSAVECLLREMGRVNRLLEKLHSVDDITLVLPGSIEWNLRDMYRSSDATSDIGTFPVVPGPLLSPENSGRTLYIVRSDDLYFHDLHLHHSPPDWQIDTTSFKKTTASQAGHGYHSSTEMAWHKISPSEPI